MLMRADILVKIKQCDGMLMHALNIFQVRLELLQYRCRSSNQPPYAHRRRWPSVFTLRNFLKPVR
jgi:hypothetical protein